MKNLLLLVSLLYVLMYFSSCQKELDSPSPPHEEVVGKLLVKVSGEKGDSNIIIDYSYDSHERIAAIQITETSPKNKLIHFKKYFRDRLGRIAVIAEIIKRNSFSSDTMYSHVYYPDSLTNNFVYTTSNIGIMGTTARDSTVFFYKNDLVISSMSYLIDSLHSVPILNGKSEYDYDNNSNVVSKKLYTYLFDAPIPVASYEFSYDNTINPLAIGKEFLLLTVEGNGSKNNISSIKMTDPKTPANDFNIDRTYSLNKAGMPDKCYEKFSSNSSYTYSYFYQ